MYSWDLYKDVCHQLYVVERKPLDEVIEMLRVQHGFVGPSRRSFQHVFRKWKFPSKYNPAYRNNQIVARVKELWARNLSQKEMLRVLNDEDGIDIDDRMLTRVRSRNRLLLRVASDAPVRRRPGQVLGEEDEGDEDDEDDEDDDGDEEGSIENGSQDPAMNAFRAGILVENLTPAEAAEQAERRRAMEAESQEKYAAKKRRRRTREWAGIPADPPGPPRFPSETTLEESKVILQLDAERYKEVRDKFHSICEQDGIVKKTLAGPERWEAAKQRLIMECMHLRAIMYGNENVEQKRLAIEVIAGDVTKHIRNEGRRMTVQDAKSILGMDPEEGRQARFDFCRILADAKFSGTVMAGPQRWAELKQTWIAGSGPLQRALADANANTDYATKIRAIECLGRDARKRYLDDMRAGKKPRPPKTAAAAGPAKKKVAENTLTAQIEVGESPDYEMPQAPSTPAPQHLPRSAPSSQRSRRVQRSAASTPQARLLPAQAISPAAADMAAIESDLSSLLGGGSAQAAFLDSQYMPSYLSAQDHHHQQQQSQQRPPPPLGYPTAAPTPVPTPTLAVYLRLDPSSSFPAAVAAPVWIAMLSGRTMGELRAKAAAKHPGSVCVGLQGIVKDDKGGELPLPVGDDQELAAYLEHMQGLRAAPVFSVHLQLVGMGGGMGGGMDDGSPGGGWA